MTKNGGIRDEFAFINQVSKDFKTYQQEVIVPNGDDAAIYKARPGMGQIVCLDTMVEDIHFKRDTMSPFHIGYKSLAVNLSDIAAMGGTPTSFLVSIAITPQWTQDELAEIYQGMKQLADQWGIDLLGGDTVSAKHSLVLSVTAIGEVEEDVQLLRSKAQPGHLLFVTGTLGDSAAGLDYLLKEKQSVSTPCALLKAHQMPKPHIKQGRILAQCVGHSQISLNDVSDGLASEAHEIATSSEVNIVIEKEKLPLSPSLLDYANVSQQDPYEWVLNGGEDFVLVGTMPENMFNEVHHKFKEEEFSIYPIGYVREGSGEVFMVGEGKKHVLHKKGYNHFGQSKE